jgi:hypothetical protein
MDAGNRGPLYPTALAQRSLSGASVHYAQSTYIPGQIDHAFTFPIWRYAAPAHSRHPYRLTYVANHWDTRLAKRLISRWENHIMETLTGMDVAYPTQAR